jgi:hypothetical protein
VAWQGVAEAPRNHDRHALDGGSNLDALILFPGALGDFLLALPALRALCARHADGRVTLAVNGWLMALAALAGVGDERVDLNDAATVGLFGGTNVPAWVGTRPRIYSWLGAGDPDVRRRISGLASGAEFFRVVRTDGPAHASREYAAQVGCDVDLSALAAGAAVTPAPLVPDALVGVPRPCLVIHAGAGARRKVWAPEAVAAIAARWRARGGGVVEVVGPAEPQAGSCAGTDRAFRGSLPAVASLLAASSAYLGNDSGVSHLAGAVGARGVAVFGPTRAERWRPLSPRIAPLLGGRVEADGIAAAPTDVARVWSALSFRAPADLDNPPGPE